MVREVQEELVREDHCLECWEKAPQEPRPDVLGVWKTRVPRPEEKKKLFVDDEVLTGFFERLQGTEDRAKINFRFVLALILMRKKLLVYDRMTKVADGSEVWQMHFKGSDTVHEVTNPRMDEDRITEVSQQLGQVLQGEL